MYTISPENFFYMNILKANFPHFFAKEKSDTLLPYYYSLTPIV